MCEHLESYLAGGDQTGEFDAHVPFHVEAAYRQYLKCGILAHGFCRAYCAGCGHDFLIAFILDPPVIEHILTHVGEPVSAPTVLPARAPPQVEMDFDQAGAGPEEWPDMDQTAGTGSATWE